MAGENEISPDKKPYKITKEDYDALLHTTERQIAELRKEREKSAKEEQKNQEKIHKEAIRLSLKTLLTQVEDSLINGQITDTDAGLVIDRIKNVFLGVKKELEETETTKEGEDPEEEKSAPVWPKGIPEGIETIYKNEIVEAEKIGMTTDMFNFVMQQEGSVSLKTPDTNGVWLKMGHIREGRDGYRQGGNFIATPNEGMTIDPGFDLGQTSVEGMHRLFVGILTPEQLSRLESLQKAVKAYTPEKETDPKLMKKLPPEFQDIQEMQLTPTQTKIMAIRLYLKHWKLGREKIPGLMNGNTPSSVKAALASKFVHRGPEWLQDRMQSYVDGLTETFRPKKSELQKGIAELKKASPDWFMPQVVQLINLGIPLPARAKAEQEKYLEGATPEQKQAFQVWHNEAMKPPERIEGQGGTIDQIVQDTISRERENGVLPRINTEKTAWSVYDIKSDKTLVGINENEPMRAASMIKPLVVLAYLSLHPEPTTEEKQKLQFIINYNVKKDIHGVEIGETSWYKNLEGDGRYEKANTLTTEFMNALGGNGQDIPEAVLGILKTKKIKEGEKYISLLPLSSTDGMTLVETIKTSGQTYRNMLTTKSVVEFYRHVYAHRNTAPFDMLLRFLQTPKDDSIVDKTDIPVKFPVASKSGTTGLSRGDGGIIFAEDADGTAHPYIFVGMFSRAEGKKYPDYEGDTKARANISRNISTQVYQSLFPQKQ